MTEWLFYKAKHCSPLCDNLHYIWLHQASIGNTF